MRKALLLLITGTMLFSATSPSAAGFPGDGSSSKDLMVLAANGSVADSPGDYGEWRFDRGMGWRYEVRSGYWSPHYVWWWVNGRAILGQDPVQHSVVYDNGSYELRGDGIETPYYWVWISSSGIPDPPPPPESAPQDAPRQPPPPKKEPPREYAKPPVYAPEPGYARIQRIPESAEPPQRSVRSNDKTVGGTIIGGTVGGVLGAITTRGRDRFAGVLIGSLLGGIVGHEIGKKLDDADELRAMSALEKNRTGQASTWVSPDSGAEVTVVPQRTFQNRDGEYCREYETEVLIGGEVKKAFGTACRQPDGQWKVVR